MLRYSPFSDGYTPCTLAKMNFGTGILFPFPNDQILDKGTCHIKPFVHLLLIFFSCDVFQVCFSSFHENISLDFSVSLSPNSIYLHGVPEHIGHISQPSTSPSDFLSSAMFSLLENCRKTVRVKQNNYISIFDLMLSSKQ
mmetsp:Transcript_35761/g.55010  ORF Transcript_35761/g.55010 Transcript_35761/m.55010 type:complete len:140 (+) Transcript_35761:40-459(+)